MNDVTRCWQRELIKTVKLMSRSMSPDQAAKLARLESGHASFVTWLEELRQLEWIYGLENMPEHYVTAEEFSFHCSLATWWLKNRYGGRIPDVVPDDIWPVCTGVYDKGGHVVEDDVSDIIHVQKVETSSWEQ